MLLQFEFFWRLTTAIRRAVWHRLHGFVRQSLVFVPLFGRFIVLCVQRIVFINCLPPLNIVTICTKPELDPFMLHDNSYLSFTATDRTVSRNGDMRLVLVIPGNTYIAFLEAARTNPGVWFFFAIPFLWPFSAVKVATVGPKRVRDVHVPKGKVEQLSETLTLL